MSALAALLILAVVAGQASAESWRVGGVDGWPTIGQALRAAAAGDTIVVAPGEYRANPVIEKPVTLLGEKYPRIIGHGEGNVILVIGDDVEVNGFSVSGSGDDMLISDAAIKIRGTGARIMNNKIHDNLFGIYLKRCTESLVEGNSIRGRSEMEMGRRGAGIHIYDADYNTIRENDVSFVRDGIYFDHSDFNLVEDNEFSNLRYGVHYMYCKDNRFFRNIFRDSVGGVAIMYTERVTFRENQILNNRAGYNAFGLLLKDCLDSVAEANVIVGSVNGIFIEGSHRNRFVSNLVAYNDVGIMLFASALDNSFSANDFIGNLATLHTVGRADAEWTPQGIGNYYSDYTGYDIDGDGIGDTTHRLQDAFEYLEGSRPLLRLFLMSAAADALAAAEKAFPLVPSSDEEDWAPRIKPVSGVKMTYNYEMSGHEQGAQGAPMLAGGSLLMLLVSGWLSWRLSR